MENFLSYMDSVVHSLKSVSHFSAAHVCSSALHSFSCFLEAKKRDKSVQRLDGYLLRAYESWLLGNNRAANTISTYIRSLRAVHYRMAAEYDFNPTPSIFKDVYTGVKSTGGRALARRTCSRLLGVDGVLQSGGIQQPGGTGQPDARLRVAADFFSLQFLFCGMPYVDLYHLRKTDLRGNVLTYRRHKTGVEISLAVPADALALLRRHADADPASPYLISMNRGAYKSFHENTPEAEVANAIYCHSLRMYNVELHRLSAFLALGEKLSSYSPRHTWADIAFHNNVPVGLISRAMGHTSIPTTEFYLKPFESDEIGKANSKVIRLVKGGGKITKSA